MTIYVSGNQQSFLISPFTAGANLTLTQNGASIDLVSSIPSPTSAINSVVVDDSGVTVQGGITYANAVYTGAFLNTSQSWTYPYTVAASTTAIIVDAAIAITSAAASGGCQAMFTSTTQTTPTYVWADLPFASLPGTLADGTYTLATCVGGTAIVPVSSTTGTFYWDSYLLGTSAFGSIQMVFNQPWFFSGLAQSNPALIEVN